MGKIKDNILEAFDGIRNATTDEEKEKWARVLLDYEPLSVWIEAANMVTEGQKPTAN